MPSSTNNKYKISMKEEEEEEEEEEEGAGGQVPSGRNDFGDFPKCSRKSGETYVIYFKQTSSMCRKIHREQTIASEHFSFNSVCFAPSCQTNRKPNEQRLLGTQGKRTTAKRVARGTRARARPRTSRLRRPPRTPMARPADLRSRVTQGARHAASVWNTNVATGPSARGAGTVSEGEQSRAHIGAEPWKRGNLRMAASPR